jgi:adenylate cyclase
VGGALEEWMPRWQLKTAHKISIGVGCGIHTGEALVGRVGSRLRDQYTALGSVVNLAARLQGEAGPGKILVSASTFERVRELVVAEQATTLTDIKNIPGTFDVFSVDGLAKT